MTQPWYITPDAGLQRALELYARSCRVVLDHQVHNEAVSAIRAVELRLERARWMEERLGVEIDEDGNVVAVVRLLDADDPEDQELAEEIGRRTAAGESIKGVEALALIDVARTQEAPDAGR